MKKIEELKLQQEVNKGVREYLYNLLDNLYAKKRSIEQNLNDCKENVYDYLILKGKQELLQDLIEKLSMRFKIINDTIDNYNERIEEESQFIEDDKRGTIVDGKIKP